MADPEIVWRADIAKVQDTAEALNKAGKYPKISQDRSGESLGVSLGKEGRFTRSIDDGLEKKECAKYLSGNPGREPSSISRIHIGDGTYGMQQDRLQGLCPDLAEI